MNRENPEFNQKTLIQKLKNLSTTLIDFDKNQIDHPHLSEEDVSMLSIVIEDAQLGIDILKKYPEFIESVLDSSHLYEDFIDMLEIVEDDKKLEAIKLPNLKLDFLNQANIQPVDIKQRPDKSWGMQWLLEPLFLNQALEAHFNPQGLRRSSSLGEDVVHLMRSTIEIDQLTMDIFLEAVFPPESSGFLRPQMIVHETNGKPIPPTIVCQLIWNEYSESAPVVEFGQTVFPLFKFDQAINNDGVVQAEMKLSMRKEE